MQTLVDIHSIVRWLVLLALISGVVFGYLRHRTESGWSPYFHQVVVMIVDIQVAVGATIWVFFDGWNRGFFFAVFHPVAMLVALGVAHLGMAIAGKRSEPRSWLVVSAALTVSLALIVAAIPWERL